MHGPTGVFTGGGPPTEISGRVVSPSANPLPEALEINIGGRFREGQKRWGRPVVLAADGSFTVKDLEEGETYEFDVWAAHCSHLASAKGVPAGSRDLLLTLKPGGTIRGITLNAAGEPAGPGIAVWAIRTQRGWCGTIGQGGASGTRTAGDGTFVLEYLAPCDFVVTASKPAPGSTKSRPLNGEAGSAYLIPEGSTGVVLRLRPVESRLEPSPDPVEPSPHEPAASAITGRLVTRQGTDVPGSFRLELVSQDGEKTRSIHPSPSGVFDTGSLPVGTWTLRAVAASGFVAGEKKDVRSGSRGVDIPLDPHGTIGGTVFASDGKPVGRGFVVLAEVADAADARRPGGRSTALTRDDGTFLVEYLGNFTFTLKAHPPEFLRDRERLDVLSLAPRGVPTGTEDVSLRLVAPVSVSGTLLAADGTPAAGVYVRAHQEFRAGWAGDQTDAQGEFRMRCLAAGRFRAFVTQGKEEVDLGEHEAPAEGLELRLPAK